MADEQFDPSTPSSSYSAMEADWQLIRDIRGGARRVREAGETYLPKFSSEEQTDYDARVASASFTAHYEDATRTLIGKPFSKEVSLQGTIPQPIRDFAENIDLAGNNLHSFVEHWFGESLHMGGCFTLVDYPVVTGAVTLADEAGVGARPYFRLIPIDEMLAIYSGVRNSKTYVRQIRFRDNEIVLDDMKESLLERVIVLDDIDAVITKRVFVKGKEGWEEDAELGGVLTGQTEIPVVALVFGMEVAGKYGIKPTMLDLANKQIEHYKHLNRIDQTFDFAGFPMLQAKGMGPPVIKSFDDNGRPVVTQIPIRVGPRTVLFAPPAQPGDKPEWDFVEPSSQSIKEMREHKKDIESEMKTLGLQPHMPSQGIQNMAATTSAINAARTHSAIQAWAFRTKDAVEQALVFMAKWAGVGETTEVYIHTDFAAEVLGDADEKELREMYALGVITWDTYVDEMQRRGILGPQFDKDKERTAIDEGATTGMSMPTSADPTPVVEAQVAS